VIVIGAGIGGLTAAALLSQAGLNVVVFEAQPRPGGYLGGFTRNGFVFDSSIQWLNQCAPGGSTHRIFSHLGDDVPRCRPLTRVCRYTGDAFDYLLTNDPTVLRNRLLNEFPDEERGIRRFFRDAERAGVHAKRLSGKIRTSETMSAFELLDHAGKMLRETVPLVRHVRVSVEQGLARYFRNPSLRNIFCHEESFMSVMMPIGWAFAGDFQAPPQGGGQALVAWLCRKLEAGGGRLFTGRRVAAVRLQDGSRVAGVTLESGETVDAPQVVAACDVETLYEKLLPAGSLPARMLKAQREADIYYSSFCVYLGLDCSPTALGLDEEIMHLTKDEVPRADQSGGDPRKTALTIVAPSVRDATLAPPGKGTLTIHCPAYMHNHDTWKTGESRARGTSYDVFKKQFADILIDRVEQRLAPGLRKHIEVLEIATPLTYWRYTGNKDGSVMGTRPTGNNIRSRVGRYRLPIEGLFLGGQWAEYGGGVPLAAKAGANAALLILKGRKKDAYEILKRVLDDQTTATRSRGIPRAL
jgi:prolycopene isomerase